MAIFKHLGWRGASLLSVTTLLLFGMTATAQSPTDACRLPAVIPLAAGATEPPPKVLIDPPPPGPLASRGVVITQYCAQNVHLEPVFGPDALAASPRVGHVHVRLDDAAWVWADASGNPVILMGLPAGPHNVSIELQDANHRTLDKGVVAFVVPEKAVAAMK
jgi:hypothetical protein